MPHHHEFDTSRLQLRVHGPGTVPPEVRDLRREVYGLETNFLCEEDLIGPNDLFGHHICLYYDDGDGEKLIATSHLLKAENSDFVSHSGLPEELVQKGLYSSRSIVAKPYRKQGLFSLLLYVAMRECRIQGRPYMYAYMEPGDTPGRKIMRYSFIDGVAPRVVHGRNGETYEVHAAWQDVQYGAHRAFMTMPDNLKAFVHTSGLFAQEIEQTVMGRINQFYENAWFKRLYEGTLTREQYIAVLSNMHQFVRWTTRLLGRVVAMTPHSTLRRHYLAHLEGEIDHEVLLEHDLEALGADVDYVMNHMVPVVEIQEFMATQESAAAFQQDPVIFLAVPFSIEGLSGHLPDSFGPALIRCMEGWGVENPQMAISFLASHVHTDGGEDGHWQMSREMIRQFVKTEHQLQKFLNIVHLVMNSQERAYAAYANIPVFSAKIISAKNAPTVAAATGT